MIFEINIFYSKLCGGKNANNLLMILISKSQFRKQELITFFHRLLLRFDFFVVEKTDELTTPLKADVSHGN